MEEFTKEQLSALKEGHLYCDINNKSTEFMIAYMADLADISEERVMDYLMFKA